ncbi:hypothetical protein GCM10010413_53530 [Promicromonospora sukumoe]|uniref:Uncharacterized protein n=1 Tax=Promicromonospora sukumoe TaxID=88382 RepID=A0A7W3JCY9_9MICO|nr:hypothetical protein [Promicromonospora sukumoe]MBA8810556.1 hypothetical protein [Promicromonospora sukumoe]
MEISDGLGILAAIPAVLVGLRTALGSFFEFTRGRERRLRRLLHLHSTMPDGRGRAALEAAAHGLAVQVAQQINPEIRTPRRRRKIDRASLVTMIFISVAGGGITWGIWQLGVISPWTWLQWTLWVLAGLVLLFVTLLVTIGGLPELFLEEKKEEESTD